MRGREPERATEHYKEMGREPHFIRVSESVGGRIHRRSQIGERGAGEACDEGRPSQSATDKEGIQIGKAMIKINHESVYSRG